MASGKKRYVESGKVKYSPHNNKNSRVQLEDPSGDGFARKIHKFFRYGLKNSRRYRSIDRSADYLFVIQLCVNVLGWLTCIGFAVTLMILFGMNALNITNLALISVMVVMAVIYFIFYFKVYKLKEIPVERLNFLYIWNYLIKVLRLALPILLLCNKTNIKELNTAILVCSILFIIYDGFALIGELFKLIKYLKPEQKKSQKPKESLLEKYQKKLKELKKDLK